MLKLSELFGFTGESVGLTDTGGHFTTDTTESALSELAGRVDTLQAGGGGGGALELGTLTQTVAPSDTGIINLSEATLVPTIVATKELVGTDLVSNDWALNTNDPLWDLETSPGSDPITPAAITGSTTITKSSGVWIADDLGKTIINNVGTGRALVNSIEYGNTLIDASITSPSTVQAYGASVKHSDVKSKFGNTSINLDGSLGQAVYVPPASSNFLETSPFTIELWFNFDTVNQHSGGLYNGLFGIGGNGTNDYWICYYDDINKKIHLDSRKSNVTTSNFDHSWVGDINNWHHLAVVRDNSMTVNVYVDGNFIGSNGVVNDNILWTNLEYVFGRPGINSQTMNGYLEEIHVTKEAKYTTNFTPHTSPLTATVNSVRLIQSEVPATIINATVTQDFPNTNEIAAGDWSFANGQIDNTGSFKVGGGVTNTTAITNDQGQIDTTNFTDMNSMSVTDTPLGGDINYAFSTDARTTWQIVKLGAEVDIDNSCLFDNSQGDYMDRTPSAGNRKTFTFSAWVKRGVDDTAHKTLFGAWDGSQNVWRIMIQDDSMFSIQEYNGSNQFILRSDLVLRDHSDWYNIVVAFDTTQSVASERIRVYIDSVRITDFSLETYPSQNYDCLFLNNTYEHNIGRDIPAWNNLFDGYMADVYFVDGYAIGPEAFGEYNSDGVWIPQDPANQVTTANQQVFTDIADGRIITPTGTVKHLAGERIVGNSSIKFDGASQLDIPASVDWDHGTNDFTVEFWFNPTRWQASGYSMLLDNYSIRWHIKGDQHLCNLRDTAQTPHSLIATPKPLGEWCHAAMVYTGQVGHLYLDGVEVATVSVPLGVNSQGFGLRIGMNTGGGTGEFFIGYMDHIRYSKTARYTTNFTPPTTAFTNDANTLLLIQSDEASAMSDYGTNGFHLDFADANDLGKDVSGQGNHWTSNNITSANQSTDSPTDNFCTLNPLNYGTPTKANPVVTLSNGNTRSVVTGSGSDPWGRTVGNFGMSSGKWYWEIDQDTVAYWNHYGIIRGNSQCPDFALGAPDYGRVGGYADEYAFANAGGVAQKWSNAVKEAYGSVFTAANTVGVALDMDAGTLSFYVDGVDQGVAYSGLTGEFVPAFSSFNTTLDVNFGATPFAYSPPAGFKALSTKNLPTETIMDGSDAFSAVTYTGNGVDNHKIKTEFAPDLIWIKRRDTANDHYLVDSIRGYDKRLYTNTSGAEDTPGAPCLTSIDSDGFTMGGSNGQVNASGGTYVAWCWKAGGPSVTNTQGSITSQVSANVDAGFSIVSWTSNGSDTVGHGLSQSPEFIITKRRDAVASWSTWHKDLTAGKSLSLDTTALEATDSLWNTPPDDSVINANAGIISNYIAYCWHSVPGYSKIGSYIGNGTSDNAFVYCGFKPAFVLIKNSSAGGLYWSSWCMLDSTRNKFNPVGVGTSLWANSSIEEGKRNNGDIIDAVLIDFVNNGFKIRSGNGEAGDKHTYIFMAFAENPFKTDFGEYVHSRDIARDNAGTWEINSDAIHDQTTWTPATTNTMEDALKEAVTNSNNQMSSVNVSNVADSQWPNLGNTLDFAIVMDTTNASGTSEVSNISFNYDAKIGEEYLTLGTDFTVKQDSDTQLTVTSQTTGNVHVKVRG